MTPEHARAMAREDPWMHEKLYAVAGKLSDAGYKQDRCATAATIRA